ncbi:MAG: LysR family transcriptional regulator [Planctomycetota bacterium]|jgi:LysR family transcriptional activator of nhaA
MDELNYHHLRYFWAVTREGSVAQAARELGVAQPTISAQLRALEGQLGAPLFERRGRRLELTAAGRVARSYAQDIFGLGGELIQALRGSIADRPMPVRIGIAEELPKLLAWRVLRPLFNGEYAVVPRCSQAAEPQLLAALNRHELDLVIAADPAPTTGRMALDSHLLSEGRVGLFAALALAEEVRPGFPASLDGAPILLPSAHSPLRRRLEAWLVTAGCQPRVAGEFDDPALLKTCAADGYGCFAAPLAVAQDLRARHGVELIAELPDVRQRVYLISSQRLSGDPLVRRLCESWAEAGAALPAAADD